jgi:hypothetical protein
MIPEVLILSFSNKYVFTIFEFDHYDHKILGSILMVGHYNLLLDRPNLCYCSSKLLGLGSISSSAKVTVSTAFTLQLRRQFDLNYLASVFSILLHTLKLWTGRFFVLSGVGYYNRVNLRTDKQFDLSSVCYNRLFVNIRVHYNRV